MGNVNLSKPHQDIDIYFIDIDSSDTQIPHLWQYLTDQERERALAFRLKNDCSRFILGRGTLRQLLGRHLNMKPYSVPLSENKFGKPFLVHDRKIHFNISHSHKIVALAISPHCQIGIDIEYIRIIEKPDELAIYCFDAIEKNQYLRAPQSDKSHLFLSAFCQKEACLKNIGIGLSLPMTQVHTSKLEIARNSVDIENSLTGENFNLQIHPLNSPDGYLAVIATELSDVSINYAHSKSILSAS